MTSAWAGVDGPYPFRGRVLSVAVDGAPMPAQGMPPDTAELRRALREGHLSLEAGVESGPRSGELQFVYVLAAGTPRLVLSLRGRAVALGVPARSQHYRFNPPTVLLPRAIPPDSGIPVELRGGLENRRLWIASSHDGDRRETSVTLSPAGGWVLIAPYGLGLGPWVRLITGLLVFGLMLPLGYWGAASRRRTGAVATLVAALLFGLLALPVGAGFPPVPWSEWLAGLSGAGAGWALYPAAAYLELRCGSPSTSESSSS
jgi:hypothetical protein